MKCTSKRIKWCVPEKIGLTPPYKFLMYILFVSLSSGFHAHAQYVFAIFFKDKAGTPFTTSSPADFISARAIARRTNQSIAVDSTDLPVSPIYMDSVINNCGGKIYETSKWLNMCVLMVYDSSAILNLAGKSFIDSIDLVGFYDTLLYFRKRPSTEKTAKNKNTLRTTSTDATYFNFTWDQTSQVQGNCLSDNLYQGTGKLIAVLDAGFTGTNVVTGFDSLWADNRVVDMHNFTYDTDYIFGWDVHGTNVLSTMAGYVPDTFVGSAPLASYALYITEYNPDDQPLEMLNMIAACERADSIGADIITESLGYDLFSNAADGLNFSADMDGKTTYAARAANFATRKGMLFVATAGNDGDGYYTWGDHITTPGDADSALTVGAVDFSGTPASFSGYGPNTAGQVKPDVCAMGEGTAIIDFRGIGFSEYTNANGTSFSTPLVAGFAACLWEAFPEATPYLLRQAIDKSASNYNSPTSQLGFGVPDFCTAYNFLDVPTAVKSRFVSVSVSPNPFIDHLSININTPDNQLMYTKLTNIQGQFIGDYTYSTYQGNNSFNIDLPQWLIPGIYLLHLTAVDFNTTYKIIKE